MLACESLHNAIREEFYQFDEKFGAVESTASWLLAEFKQEPRMHLDVSMYPRGLVCSVYSVFTVCMHSRQLCTQA